MNYFKALIRVVKSLNDDGYYHFGSKTMVEESLIKAENKAEVKVYLLNKYPQFFQNNKVYEKETKDKAQFFYVLIYPLSQYELDLVNSGEWACDSCGQIHENRYVNKPIISKKLFPDKLFCRDLEHSGHCLEKFKCEYYSKYGLDMPDNESYIRNDSPNYIYKITEKATGKCYIGKTRNEPFFRWWDHLKHSKSPFGLYLRDTKISDWTFEVLEILPPATKDTEVFDVESKYIVIHNSIENGFNTIISKKQIL